MKRIRKSLVSDLFYPGRREEISKRIEAGLSRFRPDNQTHIQGLLLPHASWEYTEDYLMEGFALLGDQPIDQVLILAPVHREKEAIISLPAHEAFETPLGEVPVHVPLIKKLREKTDLFTESEAVHEEEYSIEVLCPVLRYLLPSVPVIPLLYGDLKQKQMKSAAAVLAGALKYQENRTLIIISSNMSSFSGREAVENSRCKTEELLKKGDWPSLAEAVKKKDLTFCGEKGLKILRLAGLLPSGITMVKSGTSFRDNTQKEGMAYGLGFWNGEMKDETR